MKLSLKTNISRIVSVFLLGVLVSPVAFAVECDKDGDGYISISYNQMQEVVLDNLDYQPDGNYAPAEWNEMFQAYKLGILSNPALNETYICDNVNFKRGAEPQKCDAPSVDAKSGVFDSSKVSSLTGKRVNPGTFDAPNNGIDEDCDGSDGKFIETSAIGEEKDLGNLSSKVISLLSRIVVVVSVAILIWGGILYATAAGNERKTSKARKAIIGAVIGLIVGLLAPSIVNFIVASI